MSKELVSKLQAALQEVQEALEWMPLPADPNEVAKLSIESLGCRVTVEVGLSIGSKPEYTH